MNAPWPLKPLGDVVEQTRFIVWTFEGAELGHHVVNNPRDPGGRTLSGLTLETYSREYLRLPAPELASIAEFDALSLDDVVHVICEVKAMRTGLWRIADPALRLAVLDYTVHAGANDAIPALQRAVGLAADGILGRDTEAALERAVNARVLVAAVMDERYQKAGRVVVQRPASLGFLNGWLHRFGRVLRLTAIAALILATMAPLARAQDGGETANGVPRPSIGHAVPRPVGTVLAKPDSPVKFLQPMRAFVTALPSGVDIPVQLRIEPHADNRFVSLDYCDGRFAWPLDGAEDSAIQPVAPLTFRIFETCRFVASVIGPGAKVRARAEFVMHVNEGTK